MDTSKKTDRLEYWMLVDRVACSGDVSTTAIVVLMRLLQHRNTKTGQCNPSIMLLGERLFPKLTARSAYDKVQIAIGELKKAGIILATQRYDTTSTYKFNFNWGTAGSYRGEIRPSGSTGGLDRSKFEETFKGTALEGKYDAVVDGAKKHGVDPALLAGVMAHETGKGRVLDYNNPGGIMDPATNSMKKKQFDNLEDGIEETARVVGKNFKRGGSTVEGMGRIYAPPNAANDPKGQNKDWAGGVTKFRDEMREKKQQEPVTADTTDKFGSMANTAPRSYETRKGEPGEFNYGAKSRELSDQQTTITLDNGQKLNVNSDRAEQFKGFFDELSARGYPVDVSGGGGYANRSKRGGGGPSEHSFGNAVDINVPKNQMGAGKTDMPESVEALAWKYGMSWGARFGDPMHFEGMGKVAWKNKLDELVKRGTITQEEADRYIKKQWPAPIKKDAEPAEETKPEAKMPSGYEAFLGKNTPDQRDAEPIDTVKPLPKPQAAVAPPVQLAPVIQEPPRAVEPERKAADIPKTSHNPEREPGRPGSWEGRGSMEADPDYVELQ